MDGWTPEDMSILSATVYANIATMLNAIEDGAAWPQAMTKARAAFLEKEEGARKPLDFRLLTIMNTIYRRWGSIRLKHMAKWVEGWALGEIYAGASPQGATDATYMIGLRMEKLRLNDIPYCGGAVDISK